MDPPLSDLVGSCTSVSGFAEQHKKYETLLGRPCDTGGVNPIVTARLRLIPATLELLDADMAWQVVGTDAALRFVLNIDPIVEWPPIGSGHDIPGLEFFRSKILDSERQAQWYAYYACLGKVLVGSLGFFGPPVDGEVEIGYAVTSAYRRQGIAAEGVEGLIAKAESEHVKRVRARTLPDNEASISLLLRAGFTEHPPVDEHRLFVKDI
jgi:[ribosomal protein S5]-alanine N-acetyltransferase